jgi:hypothetical protein
MTLRVRALFVSLILLNTAARAAQTFSDADWSTLGSGMNSDVRALAVSGGDLYAVGEFTAAGGTTVNYVAKWNGSNWSTLGSGMDNYVDALAVSGTNLYAGGNFRTAGGSAASYIAKWSSKRAKQGGCLCA